MTGARKPVTPDKMATAERIRAFLAQHTTLTLATVSANGEPAAAAVFFAADEALNLYFLSEERTEHGQNLIANPAVAGTIQDDGQDWRSIQGLQLRGHARLINPNELGHAVSTYGRRFAFVTSLLAGQSSPGALAGPLARARFWILKPAWLRLVDNRVRFGHKEELRLEEQ